MSIASAQRTHGTRTCPCGSEHAADLVGGLLKESGADFHLPGKMDFLLVRQARPGGKPGRT